MNSALKVLLDHWGIELMEEFGVRHGDYQLSARFRFNETGLLEERNWEGDFVEAESSSGFVILCHPKVEVVKLPFEPKKGDTYFTPVDGFAYLKAFTWSDKVRDFAFKEAGMVFRTEKECLKALPSLRKKYLGE